MRTINKLIYIAIVVLPLFVYGGKDIHINIQNTSIKDLVKLTSRIIKKNILFTENISGNIDFVQNVKLQKNDIMKLLIQVLESKGFTIVVDGNLLRIVSIKHVARYNLPVYTQTIPKNSYQMITRILKVRNKNIDYVSLKIRHLASLNAKIINDKSSNSIIITDFPNNIKTIKKVISIITKSNKKEILTIELKNISALLALKNIKPIINSMLNKSFSEDQKIDVYGDANINAIILIGSKTNKNLKTVKNYIEKMDEKGTFSKNSVKIVTLKSIDSDKIAKTISSVISKKQYINANKKPFVASDKETNSIILMGPNDEIASIEDLIKKLDKDRMQVYVKVKIIEVSQKKINDIGIKYGLDFLSLGSDGVLGLSATLADGYKNTAISTLQGPLGGGFDISSIGGTKALALGAGINFLKQNGAINIVSEPSILCLNNKESSIYSGQTISIKTNDAASGTNGVGAKFAREDIGLKLTVKPRISNENKVTLDISVTIENAQQTKTNNQPNTSKKVIKATTIVSNGENIILGGLIKSVDEKTVDKIPFLGDIPIIGALFRNKRTFTDKQNLIIVLTPYIIKANEDISDIREKLSKFSLLKKRYYKDIINNIEKSRNGKKVDREMTYQEKKALIVIKLRNMKKIDNKNNPDKNKSIIKKIKKNSSKEHE
jgi:general secretion pathway protein D